MTKGTIRVLTLLTIGIILIFLVLNKLGVFDAAPTAAEMASANPASPAALPVQAVRLVPERLTDVLSVTGTLHPDEEVEISSEVSGKIAGIYFQEGASIAKGKVLVKVDDAELQAQLRMVRLRAELARQQEDRKKKLLEIGGISQEEYDQALTAYNTLETEAQLIEVQISKTSIVAPFGGRVGLRYVSEGSYVNPGMRVARLVKLDPIKIEFSVPEKYGNLIPANTAISFKVEGQEKIYTGRLYAREPTIDPQTRTLLMRAQSPNTGGLLIPGAFANVNITLGAFDEALMIPAESLVPDVVGQRVFLLRGGRAEPQRIQTGIRQAESIQVVQGLSPGDTLIVSGVLQLRPGMAVLPTLLN